ncbi:MAG: hypothetical protein V2I32_07685 [Desulforhopalus sp.]|nr:hypothetical protein [Desulforhopalus sp.]
MSDLDTEACMEIFEAILQEEGNVVFRMSWDSGMPGIGAGSDFIVEFMNRYYWYDDFFGWRGPFDKLIDALPEPYIPVTDATESIWSSIWETDEIEELIKPIDLESPSTIRVNDKTLTVLPHFDNQFGRDSAINYPANGDLKEGSSSPSIVKEEKTNPTGSTAETSSATRLVMSVTNKDKKLEQTMREQLQALVDRPEIQKLMAESTEVPIPKTVTVRIFPNPRRNKTEKIEKK